MERDGDERKRPAGLPRPGLREIAEDWLRSLTILSTAEPGTSWDELMARIAAVNQPGRLRVEVEGRGWSARDRAVVDDLAEWVTAVRGRAARVHAAVDVLLIEMVAEADGLSRAEVVQKLALAMEKRLPPT